MAVTGGVIKGDGDIATQLKQHFETPFTDAMARDVFMLNRVKRKSGVGTEVQWKVHAPPGNSSVGSYAETDALQAAGKQTYVEATSAFKLNQLTVQVTGFAQAAQKGEGGYFELLANEMKEGLEDLKSELNSQMLYPKKNSTYSTRGASFANDIDPIGYIVDDGQVDSGRTGYAGITFSSNTWWKPYVLANSGTQRDLTIALIQQMLQNLKKPARKAQTSAILTSSKNFDDYGNLIGELRRFTDASTLDGGFTSLKYKGIPIIEVPAMDSGDMYFLDERSWFYYVLQNFETVEKNVAGDARLFLVTHYSQLVCKELHRQGRIADLFQ